MILEARDLGHQFPEGAWGLEHVDLSFRSGEFTVVAGPNGAGKTLLMRHLVGLATPTTGGVFANGVDIRENLAEVRRRVGLVFQDSGAQIVGLTIGEEVAFGPRNLGWPRGRIDAAVARALRVVGLDQRRDEVCAHLSGGEKRRLALAGVLACEPELILLDEPFTGLDLPAIEAVLTCLVELHRSGTGLVLLTHELDKCLALADRLVLMADHRVLAEGPPAQLWDLIPSARAHRPQGGPERLVEMSWLP